ncbi:MAG: hypothetical protein HC785_30110 [Calothrix sp. CSU_2_0]|nr:hypothetical protein [Calothrix sp. CSU_2_0]
MCWVSHSLTPNLQEIAIAISSQQPKRDKRSLMPRAYRISKFTNNAIAQIHHNQSDRTLKTTLTKTSDRTLKPTLTQTAIALLNRH